MFQIRIARVRIGNSLGVLSPEPKDQPTKNILTSSLVTTDLL
jgi:hypothetical protein